MDYGIRFFLTRMIPGFAPAVGIPFPVSPVSRPGKRRRRKTDAASVTEDAPEEAKRQLILSAVLLLVILALSGVWRNIGTHMTTLSMQEGFRMIFIVALGGVWVFMISALFFLVLFFVGVFGWRMKRRRREKDAESVSEEELEAAKRLTITSGVVLLVLLAAFLVCLVIAGTGISSM